jgi:arylsulfatase A-like enzyme
MPPINRREFVATALAGAAIAAAPRLSQSQTRRPNILFILADDLGYGDLSCYGRPDYQTPNLDRLAAEGVRFANAYSASPLCTPTRCAFMTGRYPARTRVGLEEPLQERRVLGDQAAVLGLPPEYPTLASLLKQSGYETALVGKWHLGYLPKFGPIQSGFEEFFGIMSGAADFFTHKDMEGDPDLYEGKVPVERIGYTTDLLTARAVEYITQRKVRTGSGPGSPAGQPGWGGGSDRVSSSNASKGQGNTRPFYLSLHYTAPHWPWEAAGDAPPNPELRGGVAFRGGGSLKTYAAMMKSLDDGIGQVLKALRESGHERDTLVIFTSDNGGERFSYNWPFVGGKNTLWQGGIRVPAIVRWPGGQMTSKVQGPKSNVRSADTLHPSPNTLASGRIIGHPVITMDWTATILAAAQTKPDPNYPLDGIDIVAEINDISPRATASGGPASVAPRAFFWRNGNQDAAVNGRWKYLNDGTREYLFDLSIDEHEQANFRDQHPRIFEQLRTEFKKWEASVLPRPAKRQ